MGRNSDCYSKVSFSTARYCLSSIGLAPLSCTPSPYHLPLHALSLLLLLLLAGPYGVELDDSTMDVIKGHANTMHRLVNAIPPRPGCVLPASPDKPLGAWFASAAPNAPTDRGCVNAPEVSLAYYNLYGPGGSPNATAEDLGLSEASFAYANALYNGKVQVYPTKTDCCRPGGLGAYPQGCTV